MGGSGSGGGGTANISATVGSMKVDISLSGDAVATITGSSTQQTEQGKLTITNRSFSDGSISVQYSLGPDSTSVRQSVPNNDGMQMVQVRQDTVGGAEAGRPPVVQEYMVPVGTAIDLDGTVAGTAMELMSPVQQTQQQPGLTPQKPMAVA